MDFTVIWFAFDSHNLREESLIIGTDFLRGGEHCFKPQSPFQEKEFKDNAFKISTPASLFRSNRDCARGRELISIN